MSHARSVLALALSAFFAVAAHADTVAWSGVLIDHPDITNADLAGCPPGTRVQKSYDLTSFLVDTSGSYTIEITAADGMPQDADDTLLALYQEPFTGSWDVNCLEVNDDSNGVLSSITNSLVEGQHYVALVTYAWQTAADGVGATYSAEISGPGTITLFLFIDGFESGDTLAWSASQPFD